VKAVLYGLACVGTVHSFAVTMVKVINGKKIFKYLTLNKEKKAHLVEKLNNAIYT
jgi:hypothetical protein